MKFAISILTAVVIGASGASALQIPGGGPAETDCHAEFASTLMKLNYPPFDPSAPVPQEAVRCFDGESGCDLDGRVNGSCSFDIDVCLYNDDPDLEACEPEEVTTASATVSGADSGELDFSALLPASEQACTDGSTAVVAIDGEMKTVTVSVTAETSEGAVDEDELVLTCVPHGWPSHGYNNSNHRSSPVEDAIDAGNAAALGVKWQFDIGNEPGTSGLRAVTSTPAVGFGKVFVTSWNKKVYALDQETGEVVWDHLTDAAFLGVEGSPTLTADGRLIITVDRAVECLDAEDGRVLWRTVLSEVPELEMWGAATVANGRVFVGLASASDAPCASEGQLTALDLDSGEVLWRYITTPEMVCDSDTSVVCDENSDCPNDGECIIGRGAGITARPATSPDGETVYANTVGCFTFPSIGDSDSLFAFDAATGELKWKNRVQPPEQFGFCPMDQANECRDDNDCQQGECRPKGVFHDFGFLNGPLFVDADESGLSVDLVVSGSKDGTLYALDASDGSIFWTNEVVPTPVSPGLASWGLFNGAIAYSSGAIFASLHDVAPSQSPDHLQSFSIVDGMTLWTQPFEHTWADTSVANGVMFTGDCGNNTTCRRACQSMSCDPGAIHVLDGADGTFLKKIATSAPIGGGPAIVDGVVYAPYGLSGPVGGILALAVSCPCDCNFDGEVDISELTRAVNISLGADLSLCPAADNDGDGRVAVNELVLGVRAALEGCASLAAAD